MHFFSCLACLNLLLLSFSVQSPNLEVPNCEGKGTRRRRQDSKFRRGLFDLLADLSCITASIFFSVRFFLFGTWMGHHFRERKQLSCPILMLRNLRACELSTQSFSPPPPPLFSVYSPGFRPRFLPPSLFFPPNSDFSSLQPDAGPGSAAEWRHFAMSKKLGTAALRTFTGVYSRRVPYFVSFSFPPRISRR